MKFLIAVITLFFSCLHPMDFNEINEMTTCRNTSLDKIKKNLMLNGFPIESISDDDLSTGFKQTSGHSTDKILTRIIVIKQDDDSYKFKVFDKSERLQSVATGQSSTTVVGQGKERLKVQNENRQLIKTEDEFERSYYQEHRARYLAFRSQICG